MIQRFGLQWPGGEREVAVEVLGEERYRVTQGGSSTVFDARLLRGQTWSLTPDGGGAAYLIDLDGRLPEVTVHAGGIPLLVKVTDPRRKLAAQAARSAPAGGAHVKSPMPGKVVKVLVAVGAEVVAGQGVVVVEAMKMENELKAPRAGRIKTVTAIEGQTVEANQTLATIE